jgi:hypothetical protein
VRRQRSGRPELIGSTPLNFTRTAQDHLIAIRNQLDKHEAEISHSAIRRAASVRASDEVKAALADRTR